MRSISILAIAAAGATLGACSTPELTLVHYDEHHLLPSQPRWSVDQIASTPAIQLAIHPDHAGPGYKVTLNPDGETRLADTLRTAAEGWDPPYDSGDGFTWYTWDFAAGDAPVHVYLDWMPDEFQPLVRFLGQLKVDAASCDPAYLAACAPTTP
jgi:hypothetical protein